VDGAVGIRTPVRLTTASAIDGSIPQRGAKKDEAASSTSALMGPPPCAENLRKGLLVGTGTEMKPRWHTRWRLLTLAADALFLTGALGALAVARFGTDALRDRFVPAPGREFAQTPLLYAVPVWLAVFAALRLYNPQRCENALQEARSLVTAGLASGVAVISLGFLIKENPARSWVLAGMVAGTLAAAVGRQTVRSFVTRLRMRGRSLTPSVVVGGREVDVGHQDQGLESRHLLLW
jgi:hypothetical protein